LALVLLAAASSCECAATGWQHIGAVERVERLPDGVELTAGRAKVRIRALRGGVIFVRVAPQGSFPRDGSWAVIEARETPSVTIEDGKDEVRMATATVNIIVEKSPLLVTFADADGHVLLADEPTLPMAWDAERIHIWKRMPAEENYYGLGDKTGPMNRRNRAFTNWNTDALGWGESTDPLYKTIPFFVGLRKGTAYGVFFDNTYRSSFDFGKESPDYFSFGAEGGELNYYFFAGPEP
jgi:alpha-glucosidase